MPRRNFADNAISAASRVHKKEVSENSTHELIKEYDNYYENQKENQKENNNTKMISLDNLVENEYNEKIFNMDYSDIKRSIEKDGFVGTINVYDLKNGKYEIFSGHRRYRACKELGIKEVMCSIYDKPNEDSEVARMLLDSNMTSRKLSPLDYANAMAFYSEKCLISSTGTNIKGGKRKRIAEYFNFSEGKVENYMDILNLPEELKNFCAIEDFPYLKLQKAKNCDKGQIEKIVEELEKRDCKNIKAAEVNKIITQVIKDEKADKNCQEKQSETDKTLEYLRGRIKNSENPKEYIKKIKVFLEEMEKEI